MLKTIKNEIKKIEMNLWKDYTGTARTQSRLPKITRPSYPHLGQSQGSTQPQCNGRVSPWGNRLQDHGNPYAR